MGKDVEAEPESSLPWRGPAVGTINILDLRKRVLVPQPLDAQRPHDSPSVTGPPLPMTTLGFRSRNLAMAKNGDRFLVGKYTALSNSLFADAKQCVSSKRKVTAMDAHLKPVFLVI